jgi:SAM-dependent methyltransferase
MHDTALRNGRDFFKTYFPFVHSDKSSILEIGSQDVNGSLRQICPMGASYTGVDFVAAEGVDIVLDDPYILPFQENSFDIVLSSSCFEHSEFFWLVFLEIIRVLKPTGLFYMNAPSTGSYHRYPVDAWRFYPDCGVALAKWGNRCGMNVGCLESFVQVGGVWQDFVGVFLKDVYYEKYFPKRIIEGKDDYENGRLLGSEEVLNFVKVSQSQRLLRRT